MNIGAIPVAELLALIGRASLCPHHLVLAVAAARSSGPCPRCGSSELKRIFSTFSIQKTYKDVYEDILSDRELTQGMMRDDPRAIAEWNRRMSSGEKSPPEYEEMTERMEKGEWPVTQIEEKKKELSSQGESKSESG